MAVGVHTIASQFVSVAWVALRAFIGTVLLITLAGAVLAGLSYYFLRDYHWSYGAIAIVVALIESIAIGVIFGSKRALASALAHALSTLRLGRYSVRLIFERMLGYSPDQSNQGGNISRGLERLPLAKADQLLSAAVRSLTGDTTQGGLLRRAIQATLLQLTQKYTLARFRDEGTEHGGINLPKLKDELEQTIDDALVAKVRGGLWLGTLLVIVGLPLVIGVQTWLLVSWLRTQ